jgi:hypothetical protein
MNNINRKSIAEQHELLLQYFRGLIHAIAGIAVIVTLMVIVNNELNPDWLGYKRIYEDSGSWLAKQDRDPVFLFIIKIIQYYVGIDNYISFRIVVGVYFAAFVSLMLCGKILPMNVKKQSWIALMIGILPFTATRFTVQIREGIALSIMLVAMGILVSRDKKNIIPLWLRQTISLFFLLISYATHSGSSIMVVAWLIGIIIEYFHPVEEKYEILRLRTARNMLLITSIVFVIILNTNYGSNLASSFYGWAAENELSTSIGKFVYWAIYGVGISIIIRQYEYLYQKRMLYPGLRGMLGAMSITMLPVIYLVVILLLLTGAPTIIVSSAARIIGTLLSLLLLYLGLQGYMNRIIYVFAIFILIDQIRIVYEAIISTYYNTI